MQTLLKPAVRNAVGLAAPRLPRLQAELDRALTVFLFHDVEDAPSPFVREYDLAVGVRQFEWQARFIAETFTVISMDELLDGRVPARAALLTFDDGWAGVFRHALPVLRRLGLPATVFLNMAPVRGEPFWPARAAYLCRHVDGFLDFLASRMGGRLPRYPAVACSPALVGAWERMHGDGELDDLPAYTGSFATPKELEEAEAQPGLTLGNHLYRHYNLLTLSEAEAEEEFTANAEALRGYRSARPVVTVPFGRGFTPHHVEAFLGWGTRKVFTGISCLNGDPAAVLLHRVSLTSGHDRRSAVWYQLARAALDARPFRSAARWAWEVS